MLDLDSEVQALLEPTDGSPLHLTVCWAVWRNDGVIIRGCAHDADIPIEDGPYAGTYVAETAIMSSDIRSGSDGSVQNLEVQGVFTRVDALLTEFKPEDIEAGHYDQARAVLLLVDWDERKVVRVLAYGTLGEFEQDDTGRFATEVRGLTQALRQSILRSYGERCDVKAFGDERCGFDVIAVTRTGTVTAVESRKRFTASLDAGDTPPSPVYFAGSRLLISSGQMTGTVREARVASVNDDNDAVEVLLWDELPDDLEVGITFELPPACDKQYDTCRHIHANVLNFRGYGIFASGRGALIRGVKVAIGQPTVQLRSLSDFMAALDAVATELEALL